MPSNTYNVLFICRHNAARSIIAEALMNHLGRGRFLAYSAGYEPAGAIESFALTVLHRNKIASDELRCKSWDEFSRADSPSMDFVFSLCDKDHQEDCPAWPDDPLGVSWNIPDPRIVEVGAVPEIQPYRETFRLLETRIKTLINLPLSDDRKVLRKQILQHSKEVETA